VGEIQLCGRRASQLGLTALADDSDLAALSDFRWYPQLKQNGMFYAYRHILLPDKHSTQFMHNFLLGFVGIDHIDGDSLNNQRINLRAASPLQNAQNAAKRRNAQTSVYKGVYWRNRNRSWVAQIQYNRQKRHIGYFSSEVEAARAYDAVALQLFDEFANLNFCHEKAGADV
jgi:AP2 domain